MSNVNRTSTVQLDGRAFLQKAASLGLGAAALPLAESLLFRSKPRPPTWR